MGKNKKSGAQGWESQNKKIIRCNVKIAQKTRTEYIARGLLKQTQMWKIKDKDEQNNQE